MSKTLMSDLEIDMLDVVTLTLVLECGLEIGVLDFDVEIDVLH